jgi:hypothetical protein
MIMSPAVAPDCERLQWDVHACVLVVRHDGMRHDPTMPFNSVPRHGLHVVVLGCR